MTDIKPTVDMPFDEALQELTGFEVLGIQKRFGLDMERLGGIRSMLGAVWAWENRRERVPWETIEKMTLRELHGYFAERDPDPDGEQGKEQSPGEPTPGD